MPTRSRTSIGTICLLASLLASGCCPIIAAAPMVAAKNDPAVEPEPDRSDPSFFKHAPPASSVAPVASQTGRTSFAGRSLELQAPAIVRLHSGAEARGTLDAVTGEVVQIRVGDATYSYRAPEVSEIAQF